MKRILVLLVAAGFGGLGACNGEVERVLGGEPGATNDGGGVAAPAPDAATTPEADGATTVPLVPLTGGNDCTTDAQCNDDPSPSPLLGRCWRRPESGGVGPGSCLCNAGAWIQPSGKCGLAEPLLSCASAGGSCSPWATCSKAGNYHAGFTSAKSACPVEDASDPSVCCIPSSACRQTNIPPHCYRKGTDAAYTLPCINGWATCSPGDSPDLQF